MKSWINSKTIWFNIIGLVLAVAGEVINAWPSGQVAKVAGFVLTIGNIILRVFTTKGIAPAGNVNK